MHSWLFVSGLWLVALNLSTQHSLLNTIFKGVVHGAQPHHKEMKIA
jgi:hypothetical protein